MAKSGRDFRFGRVLGTCGALTNHQFFHKTFPFFIKELNLHINDLQLLTVVVALKVWGSCYSRLRIVILCDNMVSVFVINKRKTRNNLMQICLRSICMEAALGKFEI